ncbi:MAG: aromatic ring-hydroxylating dioxygenase subunit alpha, partial [Gammaproteobacteria bacterium]
MERAEQLRVIQGLMNHLDNGTNVDAGGQLRNPVAAYTCPDRAREEWQTFFQTYPQLLGLSAELAEPGSFFTSDDLGKPIICTRDQQGRFRAFLNVCRHRGTIVERARRGRKKLFSCPFHAWGYAPNGDLVAVPKEDHFGHVDKSCNGLVELPSAERHGLLFVCASKDRPFDIDDLLGDLGPELAAWELDRAEHRWDTRYDTKMNWKLAIDTFGETYHFNVLHKDTLAP